MLDCRLNWRRAGRLERAKECRGIKREQKGHHRRSLSFFPPSSLPLARSSSPLPSSFVLTRADHETDVFVLILSQLFSYIPLPFSLHPSLSTSTKAQDFSSHILLASSSSFNQRHRRAFGRCYSFALTLGGCRRGRYRESEREREKERK